MLFCSAQVNVELNKLLLQQSLDKLPLQQSSLYPRSELNYCRTKLLHFRETFRGYKGPCPKRPVSVKSDLLVSKEIF